MEINGVPVPEWMRAEVVCDYFNEKKAPIGMQVKIRNVGLPHCLVEGGDGRAFAVLTRDLSPLGVRIRKPGPNSKTDPKAEPPKPPGSPDPSSLGQVTTPGPEVPKLGEAKTDLTNEGGGQQPPLIPPAPAPQTAPDQQRSGGSRGGR